MALSKQIKEAVKDLSGENITMVQKTSPEGYRTIVLTTDSGEVVYSGPARMDEIYRLAVDWALAR